MILQRSRALKKTKVSVCDKICKTDVVRGYTSVDTTVYKDAPVFR
jgi:hypothetical protein